MRAAEGIVSLKDMKLFEVFSTKFHKSDDVLKSLPSSLYEREENEFPLY
jgi:hypothetical protein